MPITPLTALKATRIAESQQRLSDAEKELRGAQTALNAASEEHEKATSEPLKILAAQKVGKADKTLAEARDRLAYEQSQLNCLIESGCQNGWMALLQYATFGVLAAIVLGFLMYGINSQKLLTSLTSIATARGLITFLIAVVTVTIALVLILSSIVSESADRAQRFQQGKDIFVALIGVLGTIVGFYFGQANDRAANMALAPVYVSSETPKENEKITLVTSVAGGRPPFTYRVDFTPKAIADVKDQQTTDRLIKAETSFGPVSQRTPVTFTIHVLDSAGKEAVYKSAESGPSIMLNSTSAQEPAETLPQTPGTAQQSPPANIPAF